MELFNKIDGPTKEDCNLFAGGKHKNLQMKTCHKCKTDSVFMIKIFTVDLICARVFCLGPIFCFFCYIDYFA